MRRPDRLPARRDVLSSRCAIYTRKSSEEGLEQDFNSLHAQREACEAFIRSQRHEGWTCLAQHYDDGGISGATMDRPALQQLLADISARKVDVVLVYKVDRLTRSLADFAKIVEVFDGHGVSFVSVTQQFNTTSSMGRLTLNVLLSFAQFEREVTGERIRDKIAASKRKGMWMGGNPPLGYDARDGKLLVNEAEADTVRHIFRRYAVLGSVRVLQEELAADAITSKTWVSTSGIRHGGKTLARGALYLLLQNRLYLGEIVHKEQHYPGEHPAIIGRDLWEQVQARLAANRNDRIAGKGRKEPSLLAGLLFDGVGGRMTPSHAVKNGKRYRYYVPHTLITEGKSRAAGKRGFRVPAPELEQLVADRVRSFLDDEAEVHDAISPTVTSPEDRQEIVQQAHVLAGTWSSLQLSAQRTMLLQLVDRVDATPQAVSIRLRPSRLPVILDRSGAQHDKPPPPVPDEQPVILEVPAHLKRVGQGVKLLVDGPGGRRQDPNPAMVRLITQAYRLQQRLLRDPGCSLRTLGVEERATSSYLTRVLRLAWLAPDITEAILNGTHPSTLTAIRLMQGPRPPFDWPGQKAALGFR